MGISPTQTLRWRCVESRVESKRLVYGRFAISPFGKDQANTVGIAMRRALLSEIEGTSITYAEVKGAKHEYSAMIGIQESIRDISINLKEIVLRSDSREPQKAYISVPGPKKVTAQDIEVSSSVRIIDDTQHIASLTETISLDIESSIERDRGYRMGNPQRYRDGFFPVDAVFMPIRNANYSIHSFGDKGKTKEILFIEIWTDGSLTPEEALHEASRNLIDLFIPLTDPQRESDNLIIEKRNESNTPSFPFQFTSPDIGKVTKDVAFEHIFIDQSELPARAYNCLKKVDVHTIADSLNYSEDDLIGVENFGKKSVQRVLKALRKRFSIDLPRNRNYDNS